jgi:hypothetical protein
MAVRMVDCDQCLVKDNLAAFVSKWAQTDEGMGKRGQEKTHLKIWFGETGLKIRPDMFCHNNCERIQIKLTYNLFSHKTEMRSKKLLSTFLLSAGIRSRWQISTDVTRYLPA